MIIKVIKKSDNTDSARKSLLSKKWKISKTSKLIKLINSEKGKTNYSLTETQSNFYFRIKTAKINHFWNK